MGYIDGLLLAVIGIGCRMLIGPLLVWDVIDAYGPLVSLPLPNLWGAASVAPATGTT
jgi:hypothetical protein